MHASARMPSRRCALSHALRTLVLLLTLTLSADGSTVLSKGVLRNGVVSANATKFYKLAMACPDSAATLQLTLTPLQGDPDLYISATLQQPGPGGSDLSATGAVNALTLPYPTAGMYYLGVYGANASAAAFKLQAVVTLSTGAWRFGRRGVSLALANTTLPCATRREPALPGLSPLRQRHARHGGRERRPALSAAERLLRGGQCDGGRIPHGASLAAGTVQRMSEPVHLSRRSGMTSCSWWTRLRT